MDIEKLADIEHARWASWQAHVFSKCTMNEDGTATIPKWAVENWTRQIQTPYLLLTEKEKESDRREVRKYLPVVEEALNEAREIAARAMLESCANGEWQDVGGEDGLVERVLARLQTRPAPSGQEGGKP